LPHAQFVCRNNFNQYVNNIHDNINESGEHMIPKHSIDKYKLAIAKNVGKEVNLCLKKGRRMIAINNCIIEKAYESIFVIKICGESLLNTPRISVCYADLLTGNARVTIKAEQSETA